MFQMIEPEFSWLNQIAARTNQNRQPEERRHSSILPSCVCLCVKLKCGNEILSNKIHNGVKYIVDHLKD